MREFFHRIVVKWRALKGVRGYGRVYMRLFIHLLYMCDRRTGALKPDRTQAEWDYYIGGLEFVRVYCEQALDEYERA